MNRLLAALFPKKYEPTVPHKWTIYKGKVVSIMDGIEPTRYKTEAERWAEKVAREWSEQ